MSDNLPFEIQAEIIKRLPVKSLIQFRSVSKAWKSLIDSFDFIARYSTQPTQVNHLLVTYDSDRKYVSVVDDDTFPQHKVSITVPQSVKMLKMSVTFGGSHGVLCFYGNRREGPVSGSGMAVLWNPSIRKAVEVVVPNVANGPKFVTVLGFGVCNDTNDPKIVKITQIICWSDMNSISCIPSQVEVFTLSTRAWRSLYRNHNLPRKSIQLSWQQVAVDGFLYWLAIDRITKNGGSRSRNLIISFDLATEELREVTLPDNLVHKTSCDMSIFKVRNSLAVVERGKSVFVVWMIFAKLVIVHDYALVRAVRMCGELIFEIFKDDSGTYELVAYEPQLKHIYSLGIDGRGYPWFVYSYMETLLLLDQPSLIV